MYKKIIIYFMVFFLLFTNVNCKIRAVDNVKKEKVLIVYDSLKFFPYNNNIVYSVRELLGAFNTEVKVVNVADYREREIDNYDYVFVMGIEGKLNKKEFIKDLKNYNKKICWIGEGIDILLQNDPKYNMGFLDSKSDITEVYYS
ncbi:transcription factor, partial [Clostridium sporogenes]|nr:transcription factor [Clostridium sporogenes]